MTPTQTTLRRRRRCGPWGPLLSVALLLLVIGPPAQAMRGAPSDLCRAAAVRAAQKTGVPLSVLMAISLTETGRRIDGQTSPWPWTLNIEGKGFWLDSPAAALDLAQTTLAAGTRSFDVGCFQLNFRWHGEAFQSLAAMLDPDQNAFYAARFLADLYQETGDWSRAAGHYHSRTQEFADRYRRTFDTHLAALADPHLPETLDLAQTRAPRENLYPLLQSGAAPTGLGSLMPGQSGTPDGMFVNRSAKPFWSGS